MPKFRSAYDHQFDSGEVKPVVERVMVTKQCFKDDADINSIMRKYQNGTPLSNPGSAVVPPQWGDFGTEFDFHSAQNLIRESYELFDSLPSSLRTRFSNDPSVMLSFLEDESNRDEAVKLGLVSPPPIVPTNE